MNFVTDNINRFKVNKTSKEVLEILGHIDFEFTENSSKLLKETICSEFRKRGWYEGFEVDPKLKWKIQFYAENTAILYYFSNKGRSAIDLLKMQHLFDAGKIKGAIYIVFTFDSAKKVASNLACFEILKKELKVFEKIINCPILLVGLE